MHAKDYVNDKPVTVSAADTVATAVDRMIKSHQTDVWVVDDSGRFVGEIRALQFAKMLVPVTVGSHYEMESDIGGDESVAENAADVKRRLEPYLPRKVKDFVDHDIPVVRPDMPIATAIMLLRGGQVRVPVVEAGSGKLVGTLSMLTVLEKMQG